MGCQLPRQPESRGGRLSSTSSSMSRALLLTSGWRALGSLAPRSLVVPAALQPASCSAMSAERMHQLAERLSPVSTNLVNPRGISTSAVRRSDEEKGPAMDQAAMSRKVDPAEAAMKKAANEMAKKAANKKKDSGKSKKEGASEKAAADKAAAEKATAEKAAAEKAAAKKAAAEKAAAEKTAKAKAAEEKAAAEAAAKAAAEKAAAEKAAAEKAAAEKAAAEKA